MHATFLLSVIARVREKKQVDHQVRQEMEYAIISATFQNVVMIWEIAKLSATIIAFKSS